MAYSRLNTAAIAALVAFGATAANAADYAPPQCYDQAAIAAGQAPPGAVPCYVPPPPPPPPVVIEEFSGWYLRGDIGMTNQRLSNLTNVQDVNNSVQNVGLGFDSSPLFGAGVGYYFNDWLRFDVTGEYRSRANFHGTQVINNGFATYTDEYSASKSELLFLANAYLDLGTWNRITPFIGAGVGFSRNTIHSFQDVCTVCANGSVAFADEHSKWNFAWALHAGLAYKVTKDFTVELAYRYVNLGDAESGDIYTYLGGNAIVNPMEFKKLSSHDIKLGLRFNLDAFDTHRPYYAPQPVYSPPAYTPPPVYAPQPVYQPPLRSRG